MVDEINAKSVVERSVRVHFDKVALGSGQRGDGSGYVFALAGQSVRLSDFRRARMRDDDRTMEENKKEKQTTGDRQN